MHEPVMRAAEREHIVEARLAAVGPVLDVMRIEIFRVVTAGDRATSISADERDD